MIAEQKQKILMWYVLKSSGWGQQHLSGWTQFALRFSQLVYKTGWPESWKVLKCPGILPIFNKNPGFAWKVNWSENFCQQCLS